MESSSMPICSMSSGVRWAIGLVDFFCMTVMAILVWLEFESVVDVAGPGRRRDARLDGDATTSRLGRGGGGDLAVAQIPDGALTQREDAAEADAHPASGGHQHAGLLSGVQDGGGAIRGDRGAGLGEVHGAAFADDQVGAPELLGQQIQAALVVVPLKRVEQAGRAAGKGGPLVEVRDQPG